RDRLSAQNSEHAVAMAVIDIQGALATAASELRQAKRPAEPLAVVAGLEGEDGVQPGLHVLGMHNGVERAIKEHPCPEPSQRPKGMWRHGTAAARFEHALAQQLLLLDIEAFRGRGRPPHLG